MSAAETSLFELLEKSSAHPGAVSVASLQEACVRVPHLSARLTGRSRYHLYCAILFDKDVVRGPDDFAPYAVQASDNHKAVAAQLREVLNDAALSEDQLQGFVCHFAAAAGCYFDDELTVITLTLATMLAAAELPSGKEKLLLLHQCLMALCRDFVVPHASRVYESSLIPLLRLLLQYHDPLLSLHLDQRLVNVGPFLLDWVRRLFVVNGDFAAALHLWDWILVVGDPTLTVYFALAFLIAHRERFLTMQTREELTEALEAMTFTLPERKEDAVNHNLCDGRPIAFVSLSSGKALAQNADIAYQNTPRATQRVLDFFLFPDEGGINKGPEALAGYYASHAVLPLERSDIADSFDANPPPASQRKEAPPLNYIIVDCRSGDSFRFARLPTAMHIGDDIDFDTGMLDRAVEKLRGACGAHFCVFGTGRPISEEVNLLKTTALHLARAGFPYVSTAPGGFRAIVPLIRAGRINIIRSSVAPVEAGAGAIKRGFADLLKRFDRDEAVRRAEELRSRAREQVSAATSWGLSVMRRVSDGFHAAQAAARASAGTQKQSTAPGTTPTPVSQSQQQQQQQQQQQKEQQQQQQQSSGMAPKRRPEIFSLGDNENDDELDEDFDLITSVPVYRGRVVPSGDAERLPRGAILRDHEEEGKPDVTTTTTATTTTSKTETGTDNNDAVEEKPTATPPVKDIAAEIDDEFDKLFGNTATTAET